MDWRDIATIVFVCTTINHLGLVSAVERVVRHRLPVVNCSKCLTFWSVLVLGMSGDGTKAANPSCVVQWIAISLLSSYLAIWLELAEGVIDQIYTKVYEQIYPTTDTTDADAERT